MSFDPEKAQRAVDVLSHAWRTKRRPDHVTWEAVHVALVSLRDAIAEHRLIQDNLTWTRAKENRLRELENRDQERSNA